MAEETQTNNTANNNFEKLSLELYEAYLQLKSDDPELANSGYNKLYRYIVNRAYHYFSQHYKIKDITWAEEVTLETLAIIYEKEEMLQSPSTFVAFIYNKMRHMARRIFNRFELKHTVPATSDEGLSFVKMEDKIADPALNSELNEEYQMVLDAISRLPSERMRQVIFLYYIDEKDYQEIAELLDITQANARKILSRAKKKLPTDSILKKYFEDDES